MAINGRETHTELADISLTGKGGGVIHIAARAGLVGVIESAISLGVGIDAVNKGGETGLFQSCRAGHFNAVEFLVHQGANPALAVYKGETALHWLGVFTGEDTEQIAELLMGGGSMACFYSAVSPGNSSTVKHLSLSGTPLHYAVGLRNILAVQALLSRGADLFDCDLDYYDASFSFVVRMVLL